MDIHWVSNLNGKRGGITDKVKKECADIKKPGGATVAGFPGYMTAHLMVWNNPRGS